MSDLQKALSAIQQKLRAPKGQKNTFGNYSYRSCEDILEAVKPLLGECLLMITDDMVPVGDRVYVKATVTISLGTESLSTTAFAREELIKKGMDAAQITGAASSYSRKYAMNGMFLIDDNKDPDSNEQRDQVNNAPKDANPDMDLIIDAIKRGDKDFVMENWSGIIGKNWGSFTQDQTTKLNNLYNL